MSNTMDTQITAFIKSQILHGKIQSGQPDFSREQFFSEMMQYRNDEQISKDFPGIHQAIPFDPDDDSHTYNLKCRECPIYLESYAHSTECTHWSSGVYGRGTGENGIFLVGEGLGAFEVIQGKPFVGSAGKVLRSTLSKAGINEKDCYISNIVHCRPLDNRTPNVTEARHCWDLHKQADLPYEGWIPKIVVPLGATAFRILTGMQKITERHGIFYKYNFHGHSVRLLPTFHPANILYKPQMFEEVVKDFDKVRKYINGEPLDSLPHIERIYISTQENYVNWMKWIISEIPQTTRMSVDIETTGLSFFGDEIVSIAFVFTYGSEMYGISFLTHARDGWWFLNLKDHESIEFRVLKYILENYPLTFQNGAFDTKFFWKEGIHAEIETDTLDAHYMVEENGPHGLKHFVSTYISEGAGYQHEFQESMGDKTQYHSAPPAKLLKYNMDDSYYTELLRDLFLGWIKDEQVESLFHNLAMPLKRTLNRMSYRGVKMDRQNMLDLSSRYRQNILHLRENLYDVCGQKFNESSIPQLTKVFYKDLGLPVLRRTEKGSPSTNKDTLNELATMHEAPKIILEIRHLKKMCSTYLDGDDGISDKKGSGLLRFLDPEDVVHTNFLTHGTISGRLSTQNPSLLNIPKDPLFRNCFIARPGFVFLNADYASAEMVLFAYLSGDEKLIEVVNGTSIHKQVARQLLNIPDDQEVTDEQKKTAKSINFRKIYGGGYEGLVDHLKLKEGIHITEEEARNWYQQWDAAYPTVPSWVRSQESLWKERKYIESIFGRRLHVPDYDFMYRLHDRQQEFRAMQLNSYYDRMAVNFPCQSGIGDATNRALVMLDKHITSETPWTLANYKTLPYPVLSVHDEILFEVPEDQVDIMAKLLHAIMTFPLPVVNIRLRIEMEKKMRWGEEGEVISFE